jgi:mannose-6-phosphate isomerase-like protein (cupin superfamily)
MAATQTPASTTDESNLIKDGDRSYLQVADHDFHSKLTFENEGWQVGNVVKAADFSSPTGVKRVTVTKYRDCEVAISCYAPGAHDEMHCHPGGDHAFLIYQGRLHITGVESGEDLTVGPGEVVHIKGGYYYKLENPGPEPAIYCNFQPTPPRKVKRHTVLYTESARGKRSLEDASS